MFFWKIDEETIRCLIHKREIDSMGFDLQTLGNDSKQMEQFLNAIVKNSENYIDWHTENGVQNYMARALPADQLLVTISCTFRDVAIDRDLDQIKKMTSALNEKITEERIDAIYSLTGEEKEKAFEEMSEDLQNVCMGRIEEEQEEGQTENEEEVQEPKYASVEKKETSSVRSVNEFGSKKLVFEQFPALLSFCSLLEKPMYLESTLYKWDDAYILLVDFSGCTSDSQAVAFVLAAEEYGAKISEINNDEAYLNEHGREMIRHHAIETLCSMA